MGKKKNIENEKRGEKIMNFTIKLLQSSELE